MHYRRNIDEDIRRKERIRSSTPDCSDANVALLHARLRSGYISRKQVMQAAMFNNTTALCFLEADPSTLQDLLQFIPRQTKEFNINMCLSVCREIYSFYNSFMIRGSSESSEERALDAVDDEMRAHISYLVREPNRALNMVENYLEDPSHKSLLIDHRNTLEQIVELVTQLVEANGTPQQTLWNPARAGLMALTAIYHLVCACTARKKARWIASVSDCITSSVEAVVGHVGCSSESAYHRVTDTVNNSLFNNI